MKSVVPNREGILQIGYFGSYARGDWGVGSDLDIIIVVDESPLPFTERASDFDATRLPVPVDLLVYTAKEWEALKRRNSRFNKEIIQEAIWLFQRH